MFAGRYPPGAPLRETELASLLGVSRGSVREGLAQLDREGLVESGWHRATKVIDVTRRDVDEVYSLRAALDRLAATSAQSAASLADLDALDLLVKAMGAESTGQARPARLVELDIAFHDQIYAAAGNTRLTTAWQAIRSQIQLFQLRRVQSGYPHYRSRVVSEHREITQLLRGDDPERLARCVVGHVGSARASLLADLLP
jgi:DNA-binding GntR family transcriptional regulator